MSLKLETLRTYLSNHPSLESLLALIYGMTIEGSTDPTLLIEERIKKFIATNPPQEDILIVRELVREVIKKRDANHCLES